MYIKMNDDKSLLITVPTTIYRGEKNADAIIFLVPQFYGEMNMADYDVRVGFKLPNGDEHSEKLNVCPEMYKSYCMYSMLIDTKLTSQEGIATAWLTMTHNNVTQCTGDVNIIITPSHHDSEIPDYDGTSAVYVPHIDARKVLTWTVEERPNTIPAPVDLNPFDEWSDVDENQNQTDFIWEDM